MIAADPEVTLRIFQDLKHAIVIKPNLHVIAREFAVLESGQTTVISADPENSVTVLIKRTNGVTG